MELELKLDPVTLKVRAALPGAMLDGETLIAAGTGLLTVNDVTADGLPPGFFTVTIGVPAIAIASAGIDACNVVGFWYAEETVADPKVTIEEGKNPVPIIVSVKEGPPAVALAGLNAPTVGWELAGRTVRVTAGDVPPPPPATPPSGFVMEMPIVPGAAMAEAATRVVICVELT
jgi:hypothetical protein